MSLYKFNPETGKMESAAVNNAAKQNADAPVKITAQPPKRDEVKLLDGIERHKANVEVDEGDVTFREKSDLTIFQIVDDTTGKIMAYISGYALDINFNMAELTSVEKVEQLLNGMSKLFRSVIMDKIFEQKKPK